MSAHFVRKPLVLIGLAVAAACGGNSTTGPSSSSATLQTLRLRNQEALEVGKTVQISAIGEYSDASTRDLTSQFTWSSSDTSLATISPDGQATGRAPGSVTLRASLGGTTGTMLLAVLGRPWNVELAVDSVECLADCDGLALGKGEFQFDITLDDAGVRQADWPGPDEVQLGDGEEYLSTQFLLDTAQFPSASFILRDGPGSFVNLTFRATEWDKDILGTRVADSRMNNRSSTAAYKYIANQNWLPDGSNYITIGEGGCVLRMHYEIKKS